MALKEFSTELFTVFITLIKEGVFWGPDDPNVQLISTSACNQHLLL